MVQQPGAEGRKNNKKFGVNKNDNHKSTVCHANNTLGSKSAETIYRNTVQKRISSSSEEEGVDITDEMFDSIPEPEFQPDYDDDLGEQAEHQMPTTSDEEVLMGDPVPGTSGQHLQFPAMQQPAQIDQRPLTVDEKTHQMVIQAENAKARLLHKTGGNLNLLSDGNQIKFTSAMMDKDYLVIGGHVDESTRAKIVKGEYIDFGKLLPRDRVLTDDESKLELVIKNGKTFWVPTSESVSINNFSRWEQAFRIFSNIYTGKYPHKSSELSQYNHIIHTIAGIVCVGECIWVRQRVSYAFI